MKMTIFLLALFAIAPMIMLVARGGGGGHGGGGHGGGAHDGRGYNNGYYGGGYDPAYWEDTVNYQPDPESQPGQSDDTDALYESYQKSNPPIPPPMGS